MSDNETRRRTLLNRLTRGLTYAAPALVIVAAGVGQQAMAEDVASDPGYQTLAMAEGEAEAEGKAEGEAEGEGEGEGEAEGEGEGEAESEGSY